MEATTASKTTPRKLATTVAFRLRKSHRAVLESIQSEKGHAQLSDTLREAVDEYIARHMKAA